MDGTSGMLIAALALAFVVNELVTDVIKRAFREQGPGLIRLSATNGDRGVTIVVEDDGASFREQTDT